MDLADYEMDLTDTIEPIGYEDGEDDECRRGNFLHPWYDAIIRAFRARDIKIIGEKGSVIDGKNLYNPSGEEGYRGPHAISMTYCQNLEFGGYTVKDSAMRLGGTDILIDECRAHAPSRYGFRGSLSPEVRAKSAPTTEQSRHTQHTPRYRLKI